MAFNGYSKTANQEMLDNFIASGYIVADVNYRQDQSIYSVYNSIKASIKRFHKTLTVDVRIKDGKLYLINIKKYNKWLEER